MKAKSREKASSQDLDMNKVYMIGYDLNKAGKNYNELYEELKNSTSWWHHLDSTWLIYTSESPSQIWDRIRKNIDNDDTVLIIEVKNNYKGWLPEKAWEWIRNHIK